MDGSADVTTFDDGLYHPPTKSFTKTSPTSIEADPDAAMVVSAASPVSMDAPASTATSQGARPGWKSKHGAGAAIPLESFAAPSANVSSSAPVSSSVTASSTVAVSSSTAIPTPEILSIGSIGVDAPPPKHNSGRAVGVAIGSVAAVLAIVLLVGYLTSQKFRRWRGRRRARYTETKWTISRPLREDHSPGSSMREVPQIQILTNELVYGPVDPFARSMPRQSRMPFNLYRSDPVEEIDEERGWLWGTQTSKKTGTGRFVTPGLGIGRYRSKKGRAHPPPPAGSHQSYALSDDSDEIKEELLYAGEAGGASSEYDHHQHEGESSQGQKLSGVSYLLGKLKQSISSNSPFNSLGSSTGRLRVESSQSQWDEVGQLAYDDEKDIIASRYDDDDERDIASQSDDDDDEKTVGFHDVEKRTASLSSAPTTLTDQLELPELPAFTWDDHSGVKVSKTKRARAPSLEVEINGGHAEYRRASPTLAAFRHPAAGPRTSAVNSVRQIVSRLEQREGKLAVNTLLPKPSSSSSSSNRKRRDALPSRLQTQQSDPFTLLPTRAASRTRTAGKPLHPLVKAKSKHLFPGGYVGRSPTKKLRRKESPDS
ncbi:hypothetical protein PCASD_04221 [Puccinia coronata f. sp. avenae]|uniref:Uncharacterized protein n=1 Tax=Puccinia coronata f. sp. avenae TaxID=200324 RepID=A0A2N5VET9_9BASI|nr:hypothetical protein PCASD_04221 [Puccinia coronata f. sp. avenae]